MQRPHCVPVGEGKAQPGHNFSGRRGSAPVQGVHSGVALGVPQK
jgi:hypothetical protein